MMKILKKKNIFFTNYCIKDEKVVAQYSQYIDLCCFSEIYRYLNCEKHQGERVKRKGLKTLLKYLSLCKFEKMYEFRMARSFVICWFQAKIISSTIKFNSYFNRPNFSFYILFFHV